MLVISRKSPLSIAQVEEIFSRLPNIDYILETIYSYGDKHKDILLTSPDIPDDFFTRELDQALLAYQADVAIHSAKDLPYPLPAGLEVIALTAASDKTDSIVSRNNQTVEQLPQGARVGTSSTIRRNELLRIRPDIEIVNIRGTIQERIAQVDSGNIDALIVATCALQRLGLEHRITQRLPFNTHPLQGHLAVVGREKEYHISKFFETIDIRRQYGIVSLVGFGPGDPYLMTLAADKALKQADVIYYDAMIDAKHLKHYSSEKIYVGKRKRDHSHSQDAINLMLYNAALDGKRVVRLKGGDPMIFAHGREEIDFLQSRMIKVNVIPGISASIAASALTHVPLTHRGLSSSVAFVTGHSAEQIHVPVADTLVYYMGGSNIASIAHALIDAGWTPLTDVMMAYNVSMPDMKVFYSTLNELRFSVVKYPTPLIIIVGKTVSLNKRDAEAQKVLVTGTTAAGYSGNGKVVHTPLIKIEPSSEWHYTSHDIIIFTSRYGVSYFFKLDFDIRQLSGVQIFSVGKTTTAELRKHHLIPDFESPTQSAEGIINYFKSNNIVGKKILLPRSDKGLKTLSDALAEMGNNVTDVAVYTNTFNDEAEKVNIDDFQKIVFSSPSGVEAFKRKYGKLPEGIPLLAKGKTTMEKL